MVYSLVIEDGCPASGVPDIVTQAATAPGERVLVRLRMPGSALRFITGWLQLDPEVRMTTRSRGVAGLIRKWVSRDPRVRRRKTLGFIVMTDEDEAMLKQAGLGFLVFRSYDEAEPWLLTGAPPII